ncbi:MAG: DUF1592 domain-containing protein [Limnohabitans sp.]|nr:DUF1592 domain-containing protein [Limnohabitans sp.]
MRCTLAIIAILSLGGGREGHDVDRYSKGGISPSSDIALPSAVRPLLETHCVDCHDGPRGKGGFDLTPILKRNLIAEEPLRALRKRLAKRDMPPADEELRPTRDEYAHAVAAIDATIAPMSREVPAVRRRNRAQYAGAVRDVFGVEISMEPLLPADEIGEGFDTTGDTLALSPLLVEKYFDAAEAIASMCVPDARQQRTVIAAEQLERVGQGGVYDGFATLATNGALSASTEIAVNARYRITVRVAAQQAGDELARAALEIDGTRVLEQVVEAESAKPESLVWEGELRRGLQRLSLRFLNDFWDPKAADPKRRDRNLLVAAVEVEGPLGPPQPTPFEMRAQAFAGEGSELVRLRRVASAVGEELFGRTLASEEAARLAAVAREAATARDGKDAAWNETLRALVTALLVDPRFLLCIERAAPDAKGRDLSGDEIALRMANFLWSSVPDQVLREAARAGHLATPDDVAREARRMLRDPRAISLSKRFATQWLGIDGLPLRSLDPKLYPTVDPALLASMQAETEALFARVVEGAVPVRALLESRVTSVDRKLAKHYGFEFVDNLEAPRETRADRRFEVELPATRASGVLGHASILLATSNPTRTSPVKRGKWVLEALLDEAPPPPPPGVPQLPETKDARAGLSMRELMRLHRENPDCASCHVRMDAYGLAFEAIDADGRLRTMVDGIPVDDTTELPDGSLLAGARGIEAHLRNHDGFERSLARRLLIYALGRGTADADDTLLDQLANDLRARGEFATLVEGIVRSDAFRRRNDFLILPSK